VTILAAWRRAHIGSMASLDLAESMGAEPCLGPMSDVIRRTAGHRIGDK
jgi:hypothetical protein